MTVIKVLARFAVAVILLVLFAASYQVEVLVAPEWSVTVVDEGGQPMEKAIVGQLWSVCFEYIIPDSLDYRLTDKSGTVRFPRRTHQLSLAAWAVKRAFFSSRSESVEGHCVYSQVLYWKTGFAEESEGGEGWHDGMASSPRFSRYVLHPCPEGKSGFKCGFDLKLREWQQ